MIYSPSTDTPAARHSRLRGASCSCTTGKGRQGSQQRRQWSWLLQAQKTVEVSVVSIYCDDYMYHSLANDCRLWAAW